MSFTRADLEHLSLVLYIKEAVLAKHYTQQVQSSDLIYDGTSSPAGTRTDYKIVDPNTDPFGSLATTQGRGWCSFELGDTNPCMVYNETTSGYVPTYGTPFFTNTYSIPQERETNLIKVKDQNGNEMPRTWYQIDYVNGRIRFPAPMDSSDPGYPAYSGAVASGLRPTKIDYSYHMVSVLDGWPDAGKVPTLPVVCVYPEQGNLKGIQIGPGVKFESAYCIDVFGLSGSNRKNILDNISHALYNKHVPVIDFNRTGLPLNHHGTVNKNFIQDIDFNGQTYKSYLTLNPGNGNILYFLDNETLYDTTPRGSMSVSMRHMGKIRLSTYSFSDRDPSLVGKFNSLEAPPGGLDSLIQKGYSA